MNEIENPLVAQGVPSQWLYWAHTMGMSGLIFLFILGSSFVSYLVRFREPNFYKGGKISKLCEIVVRKLTHVTYYERENIACHKERDMIWNPTMGGTLCESDFSNEAF